MQEIGGLAGRVALAYLAVIIVSRRKLDSPVSDARPVRDAVHVCDRRHDELELAVHRHVPRGVFHGRAIQLLGQLSAACVSAVSAGTGESFAANIGGRLIGTSFAWLTATLAVTPDRAYAPTKVAYVAAAVGFSVYLVGFIASFWLPEPPKENLPD